MAKKKFNIKSTLKKNTEISLPERIPLRKSDKDIEMVKEKVEEIHRIPNRQADVVEEMAAPVIEKEAQAEFERPQVEQAPGHPQESELEVGEEQVVKKKKVKAPKKQKLVRMTIDTPSDIHMRLKIRSIEKGMSLRDYMLLLMERELNRKK